MGLLKAGVGALSGVLADSWREYFYCDALEADILAAKGKKRSSKRSSNTKGEENIISNGSIIAVNDGQCMMIVEQGAVVEFCAEPGEFVWDSSTEPTIWYGGFKENLRGTWDVMKKRFTFGGDTAKDQRIYYFNTKELLGNKYGTANPVPFRVVDSNVGLDIDISVKCFGEYSYHICDPMLFYKNVCGNIAEEYNRQQLDSQLKTELLTALQPAFARISAMGIRYSSLPGHTMELADALNEVLSQKWRGLRGIEIVSFGVSSIKANEEDEAMIKELQRNAALRNPTMAAAHLVGAQAEAMQSAATNENGAMMGFMGMGLAQQAGGANTQGLYQMGQQPSAVGASDIWQCSCGTVVNGNFCPQCGCKKPQPQSPAADWKCVCGAVVHGNFCPECGSKKPLEQGWLCSCGAVNKGRFCSECGAKKPAGVPLYKCDKCGWEPQDAQHPPKFCPECGDPFTDEDVQQ